MGGVELRAAVDALSIAPLIEAAVPGKLSTVSGFKQVKDLSLPKYAASTIALRNIMVKAAERGLRSEDIGYGELILEGVNSIIKHPLIGTNTVAGYLMISVPLAYMYGACLRRGDDEYWARPELLISNYWFTIKERLKLEEGRKLYEALRAAGGGGLGRFKGSIPDVRSKCEGVSVWEILENSAHYDIIAYDVTRSFKVTLEAYEALRISIKSGMNLDNAALFTHRSLLSRYIDTLVMKAFGISTALLVKGLAGRLRPNTEEWNTISSWLRSLGVNPGSIADITAAAIALYLVSSIAGDGVIQA